MDEPSINSNNFKLNKSTQPVTNKVNNNTISRIIKDETESVRLGAKGNVSGNGSSNPAHTIHNRYPNEPQAGNSYNYAIKDGKLKIENGIKEVDFVVDMDGNLNVGKGHSYLANGGDVQAAGSMKVNNQGYVRRIDNSSGHYAPTVEQGKMFPEILNNIGLRTKNAWLELGDYSFTSSGYVDISKTNKIIQQIK